MTFLGRFNPIGPAGGLGVGFNTNCNENAYNPPGPIGGPGRGGGGSRNPGGPHNPTNTPYRQAFRQDLLSDYGNLQGVQQARQDGQKPVLNELEKTANGTRSILEQTYGSPQDVRTARREGQHPVQNALNQFFGIA